MSRQMLWCLGYSPVRSPQAIPLVAWGLTLALSFGLAPSCPAQEAAPLPGPGPLEPPKGFIERPISLLKASIELPGTDVPENQAAPRLEEAGIRYQPSGLGRGWILQPYEWEAAAVRHLPLYFEEPNLERLGYYYGLPCDGRCRHAMFATITEYMATLHDDSHLKQCYFAWKCKLDSHQCHTQLLQPAVSAAHFFGRVAALPYMVGACCPEEEIYTLGEDRPGSPAPFRKYYIPLSLKGALYQGAAVTGLGYLIP